MAIERHPLTGVFLNVISVRRKALDRDDALTAVLLRQQGDAYHVVAQKLGTNTHRLGKVFRGEAHQGVIAEATAILSRAPLRPRRR